MQSPVTTYKAHLQFGIFIPGEGGTETGGTETGGLIGGGGPGGRKPMKTEIVKYHFYRRKFLIETITMYFRAKVSSRILSAQFICIKTLGIIYLVVSALD